MDARDTPDHSLAGRIRDGDAVAEKELASRYAVPLRLILMKRVGNPQLACDLAQDTFVIAIQKLRAGEIRNPEALPAFLRQIAINLSIEHYRREKRYVRQDDGIIELHVAQEDMQAKRMDRRLALNVLRNAMDQLAQPRDREILQRFYLLEEDKSVICSALDLSAAHFDRVLYRAKQRMRELLNEHAELRSLLLGGLPDG